MDVCKRYRKSECFVAIFYICMNIDYIGSQVEITSVKLHINSVAIAISCRKTIGSY